jgi:hypothetical protein
MLSLPCRLLGGKFRAAGFFIPDSMRRDWRVDMLPQRSIPSHTKANGSSDFGRATSSLDANRTFDSPKWMTTAMRK